MKFKWIAVTILWLWVCSMFALAFGSRGLEYWNGPDLSHSVTVPIQPGVVKVEVFRKPETVVEKVQERVEAPPIRPSATVDECPAPAAVEPLATPVHKSKIKRRKISVVKKAPASAPVLVGGQPQ